MSKTITTTQTRSNGVHWGWWVLWALVFWPALLVVALIHYGKAETKTGSTTETVNDGVTTSVRTVTTVINDDGSVVTTEEVVDR